MEIKRENGDRYQIKASFCAKGVMNAPEYYVDVLWCPKGKRKFVDVHSTDSYEWRRLDNPGRGAYKLAKQLQHVTADEIDSAKLACWELLKPEPTKQ